MSQFDPYHKWLGIAASEQPAHHYRLLGLTQFESDPDAIESAADRQMAHVRTFQASCHSAHSQRLLNELAAAKLCLLSPDRKATYDEELRAAQQTPLQEPLVVNVEPMPAVVRLSGEKGGKHRNERTWMFVAAGCIGAVLIAFVVFKSAGPSSRSAPQGQVALVRSGNRANAPTTTTVPKDRAKSPSKNRDQPLAPATKDNQAVNPPTVSIAPKILQTRKQVFNQDGSDLVQNDDQAFFVGLTGGVGFAAIGYELEGTSRVELEVAVQGDIQPYPEGPENSFVGLMIDYQTAAGYSHRVAISLGLSSNMRASRGPDWGAFSVPDRFVELPVSDAKSVDLAKWAPDGWNGLVWLSAVIQNSGANTALDGRITKLAGR